MLSVLSSAATEQQSQGALLAQLVECLLLEGWFTPEQLQTSSTEVYAPKIAEPLANLPASYRDNSQDFFAVKNTLLVVNLPDNAQLLLPVTHGYSAPWRLAVPCLPLYLCAEETQNIRLDIIDNVHDLLNDSLSAMDAEQLSRAGVSKLQESLAASIEAAKQSAQAPLHTAVYARPHAYQTLIAAEAWASLMDRPFHPLAKGKLGLNAADYARYMAEFHQPIFLNWVAVARSHIMCADAVQDMSDTPAHYVLNEDMQALLTAEMQDRGLDETHIALPVHPWQLKHELPAHYADDMAAGTVVVLNFAALPTYASASLRSMLLSDVTPHSIKLPLGVYALNSKRYLPALKLINGEKNQALLTQAKTKDRALDAHLHLWDERRWWGYMPPEHTADKSNINPYFYQEKSTHLGAMLRTLPKALSAENVRLLPMASLGMCVQQAGASYHLFDELIAAASLDTRDLMIDKVTKQLDKSAYVFARLDRMQQVALGYFYNLCDMFLGTMLRCLRLGLAPEMHGQNIVLAVTEHQFSGVLLRDHDSVRIHLPWLVRHDLADPEYLSPPDFKNRLYRETPEALVFYMQSLGILVNLRAVIESLASHYQLPESSLWQTAAASIQHSISVIDFDTDQANLLHELLLTAPTYPYKTMLLPVIERGSDAHGSMPAGESTTVNPFVQALTINSIAAMTNPNNDNNDDNDNKDSYDYRHLLDRYSRAD
ncbi:IucA/IucC family protein [Psychrobacter aestuarii]|uniref:IucA/IucC family siderophore biosynthesis protein n=1 Tax=Psychrobacter aestuarii TaxID=556327 RepID=A0ABP3FFR5_9GAMM|nr:IucA/IucC family protein [Psychrobacter aestuarii]